VVVSLVAYGRILGNDFVNFDDNVYITENSHVRSGLNVETIKWAFTAVVSSNWHPLTLISHALDWSLFKDHVVGHHLVNLLLHIFNVILLFLFLNKITKNRWPAAFAALLFALHPLRVESVAWAAERKDVLSMFFGLWTLYAYAFYVAKPQVSKYILCLILFALGLMSKPMLVTLPFVLLLLDFWPLERWKKGLTPEAKKPVQNGAVPLKKKRKQLKATSLVEKNVATSIGGSATIIYLFTEKVPFIFFALMSSIITIWAQNKGGAVASLERVPFSERLINAIVSYISYLGKTFWPVDLAVFYPYEHAFTAGGLLGAVLILLVISIFAIYLVKKAPFFLTGWLWYLGTLVPVIGLVQVGRQSMADRYMYLPSIGIGIIIVWGLAYLLPQEKIRKFIFVPVAAIVLMILSFLTWQQCGYWKNSITLFEHTLQVTKNNYLAHTNLGIALAADGKIDQAMAHYDAALKIKPNDDNAHYNLGNIYMRQGNNEEAIKHFQAAVRLNPTYFPAHNNLGVLFEKQTKNHEAIEHYRQAFLLEPNNPGINFNLGVALARSGKLKEAIEYLRMSVYLNPNDEQARRVLREATALAKSQEKNN
jgi:tetratricopeptide (TPR) repeat protein